MAKNGAIDPIELLLRRGNAAKLLVFFQRASELLSVAFSDAAKQVPARPNERPAVSARGNLRRLYLDMAFRAAAEEAKLHVVTRRTTPPTWDFPAVRVGAFSITLGIAERTNGRGRLRLRSHGQYVRDFVERNEPVNPQGSLFRSKSKDVVNVIPDGSLGGFIVVEPSVHVPDSPLYIGFMVPSPSLRRNYFRRSLERLISMLQQRVAAERKPLRKPVERKKPVLKKRPKRPPGE